jgi:O-antigen ligase
MENGKRSRGFFLAVALVAFVSLILTKSRTSFAGTILALFVYGSLILSIPRKFALFLSITFAFCLLLLILGNELFPALQLGILLGRESDPDSIYSLTGRVPLWKECLLYVAKRPLHGYGYGGFWTAQHIKQFSTANEWGITFGHSAYIDLLLDVGLLGMVTYFLIMLLGIGRSLVNYRTFLNPGYAFFGALLTFCVIDGLADSTIILPSLLTFLSTVVLTFLGFKNIGNKDAAEL